VREVNTGMIDCVRTKTGEQLHTYIHTYTHILMCVYEIYIYVHKYLFTTCVSVGTHVKHACGLNLSVCVHIPPPYRIYTLVEESMYLCANLCTCMHAHT